MHKLLFLDPIGISFSILQISLRALKLTDFKIILYISESLFSYFYIRKDEVYVCCGVPFCFSGTLCPIGEWYCWNQINQVFRIWTKSKTKTKPILKLLWNVCYQQECKWACRFNGSDKKSFQPTKNQIKPISNKKYSWKIVLAIFWPTVTYWVSKSIHLIWEIKKWPQSFN